MAYYNNRQRQLVTYRETMNETFGRLQEHLQVDSVVNIDEVNRIASNIGESDMSINNIHEALDKATRTSSSRVGFNVPPNTL